MKKFFVVKNEQHSLLPEQERILLDKFKRFEFINIPANGLTAEQIKELYNKHIDDTIIFLSPIPLFLKYRYENVNCETYLFHNDKREKKELPNGRVIMTVAKTGWKLY